MVDNGEATFSQWENYKAKVSARQSVERERNRMIEEDRKDIERQEAEFLQKYPTEKVEDVWNEFSSVTKDGKPNPSFKPASIAELRDLRVLRQAGGLEAYVQSKVAPQLLNAKREAVKEVVSAKRPPHLDSSDSNGEVIIPQIKAPRSAQEADNLMITDRESYDKWLETLPFLQNRRTG
jgi:hypothetical protein